MATLTKKDVEFEQATINRIPVGDGTYIWYVNIGYMVTTNEGESYHKNMQLELTGSRKTAVINFFSDIYSYIKTQEGIT